MITSLTVETIVIGDKFAPNSKTLWQHSRGEIYECVGFTTIHTYGKCVEFKIIDGRQPTDRVHINCIPQISFDGHFILFNDLTEKEKILLRLGKILK